jgi:hypothetical protein
MLADGAKWRAGGAIIALAGAPSTGLVCEPDRHALCERINATLNIYAQVLGSRTARRITDDHAE